LKSGRPPNLTGRQQKSTWPKTTRLNRKAIANSEVKMTFEDVTIDLRGNINKTDTVCV